MNALDLMHKDHRELKEMLEQVEKEESGRAREQLLDTIRTELVAHERMEEEVFYPALKGHKNAKDIVLEGYEEHHVVDVILDELMDVPPDTDLWKAKMKVLKENIEHHIKEEEGEMFKKARAVFEREELTALGERMLAVKEEALP
jgi:hypothetical protein